MHESVFDSLSGHNIVELLLRDLTIFVLIGLLDHLGELMLVDVLPQILHDHSQVGDTDKTTLVQIEQGKHFSKILLRIFIGHPLCHQIQKLMEIDLLFSLIDQVRNHMIDGLVLGFCSKGGKGSLKLYFTRRVHVGRTRPLRLVSKRSNASLIYWI